MAKWQGTKIPNTGYVEKIYLNTALNADEVVSLVENAGLNYFDYQGVLRLNFILAKADETFSLAIFKTSDTDFAIVDLASNYIYFVYVIDPDADDLAVDFIGWNPDFNGVIEINSDVINNVPNENIAIGVDNDKLTSLFSVTPFIKGEETTADKLQKLIDGKQYVIDKVNAKAGSDLKINSTWQSVGDAVEGIQSGGENTLKKLLDYTKNASYIFNGNTMIIDLTGYINYSDTSNVTNMQYMFSGCTNLTTIPQLDTSNVTNMGSMFSTCRNLTTIPPLDTSKVTNMSSMFYMGQYDTSNKLMTIPQLDTSNVTDMNSMFYACGKLQRIEFSFYNVGALNSSGFCNKCYSLKTFIIRSFGSNYSIKSNVFTGCYHILGTVNATYNPDGLKDGYIYVPRDMVDTLKSATNWSTYADQIRALEDYTVDGTTTGELDESKVNA